MVEFTLGQASQEELVVEHSRRLTADQRLRGRAGVDMRTAVSSRDNVVIFPLQQEASMNGFHDRTAERWELDLLHIPGAEEVRELLEVCEIGTGVQSAANLVFYHRLAGQVSLVVNFDPQLHFLKKKEKQLQSICIGYIP